MKLAKFYQKVCTANVLLIPLFEDFFQGVKVDQKTADENSKTYLLLLKPNDNQSMAKLFPWEFNDKESDDDDERKDQSDEEENPYEVEISDFTVNTLNVILTWKRIDM